MKCTKCSHFLSDDELVSGICYNCGKTIDRVLNDDLDTVIVKEKSTTNKTSEFEVIRNIHDIFKVLSILAIIGSLIMSFSANSFPLLLMLLISLILFYCFIRMLIGIAYILCEINDKISNTAN